MEMSKSRMKCIASSKVFHRSTMKSVPLLMHMRLVHYTDAIMTTMASQITSLTVVYSTVYSDVDQRKHQSSASLAIVWGIHRDRWIPRTKGQLRGKCFHLMTSSCVTCDWPSGQGIFFVFIKIVRHILCYIYIYMVINKNKTLNKIIQAVFISYRYLIIIHYFSLTRMGLPALLGGNLGCRIV